MIKVLGLVGAVVVALATYYVYLGFFKPIAPVPSVAYELAAHFSRYGIVVNPSSIRHGYSDLEAAVDFTFKDRPLPISVSVCDSLESAKKHFLAAKGSPNLNYPAKNGQLVMYLVYWEESEFTNKKLEAFNAFSPST